MLNPIFKIKVMGQEHPGMWATAGPNYLLSERPNPLLRRNTIDISITTIVVFLWWNKTLIAMRKSWWKMSSSCFPNWVMVTAGPPLVPSENSQCGHGDHTNSIFTDCRLLPHWYSSRVHIKKLWNTKFICIPDGMTLGENMISTNP